MMPMATTFVPALVAAPAGLALGWFHFATLARVSELLVAGRLVGIGLQLARFALLTAFLWLCARQGWPALAGGGAGIMAGRALALRRAR